ncbi:MAG: tRNA glutamyl-Q(34) synthetase GluQRS [Rhodospirillaceae bacterium]|nr:tRNA glutamyl-Q(34) synthetase GluQRS [Rhodospirillaceae bacterium]
MAAETTRFAPSPTGFLHAGHAFSARFAAEKAGVGGRFLLRIEDIDRTRCRPEFETAIFTDLAWLGLSWETPVRRQSEHFDTYKSALADLERRGLLYPCFCTRADIQREIAGAASAPHLHMGPEGPVYPGTCRHLSKAEQQRRKDEGTPYALRLRMDEAANGAGPLTWRDQTRGEQKATPEIFGDVVLGRKDTPASYHLAVTLDDAVQGITLVTRGEDLFAATHVHRLLQALFALPVPAYAHHRLRVDREGKKFSKRDNAATIQALREKGVDPRRVGV